MFLPKRDLTSVRVLLWIRCLRENIVAVVPSALFTRCMGLRGREKEPNHRVGEMCQRSNDVPQSVAPILQNGQVKALRARTGFGLTTNTLIIDTGTDIVGVYFVEEGKYLPYQGHDKAVATRLIQEADEVVTYHGTDQGQNWPDMRKLAEFAGMTGELPLRGQHIDMAMICWPGMMFISTLRNTFHLVFGKFPQCPDDYVGNNRCDVFMTYKLWQCWMGGGLKIHNQLREVPRTRTVKPWSADGGDVTA